MKRWFKNLQKTHFFKSVVYFIIGVFSYPGIAIVNKLKIRGTEHLKNLPKMDPRLQAKASQDVKN